MADSQDSDFGLANIPFGIASSTKYPVPQPVTRLYNIVIFIRPLISTGLLSVTAEAEAAMSSSSLNQFASLGRKAHRDVRHQLKALLSGATASAILKDYGESENNVTMHIPVLPRDFTDFVSSEDHGLNSMAAVTGKRFIQPIFYRFPWGYGGRASSIVVSGSPINRPAGVYLASGSQGDGTFAYTEQLDFELEIGVIVGKALPYGESIDAENAGEHMFGVVLVNDWSARDIQIFEMQLPLGAVNSKAFATAISPWVITMDALEACRSGDMLPRKHPQGLKHLEVSDNKNYEISLQADVIREGRTVTICRSSFLSSYWTFSQYIAQQSTSCCGLNPGDLLASGTISGGGLGANGCLLELSAPNSSTFPWPDGSAGGYLKDGDVVQLSGKTNVQGLGIGVCSNEIKPSRTHVS